MSAALHWIALTLAPGLGVTTFWRLVDYFGSPEKVLAASVTQLQQVPEVRKTQISGLAGAPELLRDAERELQHLKKAGAAAIIFTDETYPAKLKDLADPPPVLYLRGDKRLLAAPMVAIVGSRASTTYGRRVARKLGDELSHNGLLVISGLALGIDTEAHLGSLDGSGTTIAVLGCGLDIVYPRQNKKLFDHIAKFGAVITEYPLGTRPEPFRFPARNRIIAGMAMGVVVVEATRKSGSLITAQIGLDLSREIFAVPGQVDSAKSEGTHWLLQQGARLVSCGDDIFEELGVPRKSSLVLSDRENDSGRDESNGCGGDSFAGKVLGILDNYPQSRDGLLEKLDVSPALLSETLLLLELDGEIEMLPGNLIRKIN